MSVPLLEFKKVDFHYPNSKEPALKEISFAINEGDYVAFHGTSGSGKSTLMSILGLINFPTSGDYLLSGVSTSNLTRDSVNAVKNQEVGFIFQNFNLLSRMTVIDNVCLPLTYNNKVHRKEYKDKAKAVLEMVGMSSFLDRKPHELSGGQQQRVAIARALVCDPSLILADEPTGNLDSENSAQIYNILEQLNRDGKTICLITHDQNYALKAKTVFNVSDGRLTC